MSALDFRPHGTLGKVSLVRRYQDATGVTFQHIAALPAKSAEVLRNGGYLDVALRAEHVRNGAPWVLSAMQGDEVVGWCCINDTALETLLEKSDQIEVRFDHRDAALLEQGVRLLRDHLAFLHEEIARTEAQIADMEARRDAIASPLPVGADAASAQAEDYDMETPV